MTVHNAEKTLQQAISSIREQTYTDFEFHILDDGSTDWSREIIKKNMLDDNRILWYTQKNAWIIASRNTLIWHIWSHIRYMLILDADDVARPSRMQKQLTYLNQHPDVWVVWSNIDIINKNWEIIGYRSYNWLSQASYLRENPLAQPACMVRMKALIDVWWNYSNLYDRAEDYELWLRIWNHGWKLWNIDESLTQYRVFDQQWKSTHLKISLKSTLRAQKKYIFKKKYFNILSGWWRCMQHLLFIVPNKIILFLFKKTHY